MYPAAGFVDSDDADGEMLVEGDDLCRVGDALVRHFGDVDKSVFVDAEVHKSAEIGDVGDNARQEHAHREIVNGMDVFIEVELFDLLPRQLPYEDFIRWLARNQSRDPEMVVRKELITIRR